MKERGLGWREDANPFLKAAKLSRAPGILIGSGGEKTASLRKYRHRRLYQGGHGACVAKSLGRVIHVGMQLDGVEVPPMPSTRHLYEIGRAQEHAGSDPNTRPALIDRGMYPSLGLEAVRKVGFCEWDLDPYGQKWNAHYSGPRLGSHINDRPPSTALRNAIDQSGLRWFDASYATGHNRSEAIADGMNADRPIGFIIGMDVDTPFLHHRGSDRITSIDPSKIEGGHMLWVAEILPGGHALIDNWWEDWGGVDNPDDGYGILDVELLGSRYVRNVYGILSHPSYA